MGHRLRLPSDDFAVCSAPWLRSRWNHSPFPRLPGIVHLARQHGNDCPQPRLPQGQERPVSTSVATHALDLNIAIQCERLEDEQAHVLRLGLPRHVHLLLDPYVSIILVTSLALTIFISSQRTSSSTDSVSSAG